MALYKKKDVDKRLKGLGASPLYKEGRDFASEFLDVKIKGIPITHGKRKGKGMIPPYSLNRLARELSSIALSHHYTHGGDVKWFKKVLSGREKPESLDAIVVSSIVLGLVLIAVITFFIPADITGYIVYNNQLLSPLAIIGFIVLIIAGYLYWRKSRT